MAKKDQVLVPAAVGGATDEIVGETKPTVNGSAPPGGPPSGPDDQDQAKLAAVEQAKRNDLTSYLRKAGKWTWRSTAALLLLATGLSIRGPVKLFSSEWTHSAPGRAVLAAVILWVVLLFISVLKRRDGGLAPVLIGGDGRFSTSHFQAWIWTLVLAWAFLYFVVATAWSGGEQLTRITNDLSADYLLLLGGPFLALIGGQQIANIKRDNGTLQKVSTEETTAADLISDDAGRADLIDLQYLLFNAVALAFFFASFVRDQGVLPDLPDGLVALTSASALAYIAKKAVASNTPSITSIVRADGGGSVCQGDTVLINGYNFVPAGSEAEEYLSQVRVRFDGFQITVPPAAEGEAEQPGDLILAVTNITATTIRVQVPDLALTAPHQVQVSVATATGAETNKYPLTVHP